MAGKKKTSDRSSALRQRAEAMLIKQRGEPDKIPPADVRKMFHELQVNQIELELQNDELCRTQEELETSRKKYFDLYDLAPVGYITLNEKGIILESNLTAAVLLGKERGELVRKPLTHFISREDQDIYYNHSRRLIETRQRQECEVRMPKGDGTLFWARLETIVVKGNNGEPALRTMISAITENERAGEAHNELKPRAEERHIELSCLNDQLQAEIKSRVEEGTRHLASFPQLNPNPVIEIDSLGKVTFSNQATLETLESLGMDKGDVDAFLPPDLAAILHDWDKRNETTIHREIIVKDLVFGETIQLVPQFEVARIYAADITERKRSYEELRKSEERFRLLVAGVKDYAIFMLDPEGRVETWNAGAERMKGYKAEEIIGEHFSRFYAAEGIAANEPEKELNAALETGQVEKEGWRVRKDGSLFWASVLITALHDDNGVLRGFSKITRDITERKQAEEARRDSERTQRLLAQVGELATRLRQGGKMVEAICECVAREFGVSRCGVSLVDLDAGQVTVLKDYYSYLSSLAGVYPTVDYADYLEDGLAGRALAVEDTAIDPRTARVYETHFAPIQVRAHLTVPLLQGGNWVANFWVSHHEPRHWTAAEVKAMTLIADRVWLALERQRVDDDLRKSEERFRALTMASSDVVYRMSPDWSEMRQLQGRGFLADTEKPNPNWLQEYIHPDDQSHVMAVINEAIQTKGIFELEHRVLTVDGSLGWTFSRAIPLLGTNDEIVEWFGAASDVSERKQAEWEQETAVEFLRLVIESRNTLELVKAATAFFQERTGCEAVGIRLREEHDYPYFETQGFPAEFVRAESSLCACDKDGRPILDSAGNPALDCMCGNVICGRFDPSKPFFTKRGNFWSNSTTRLLAATSDKDRQAKTRNRCNGEGYESVALIGLSIGDERLGLLQLNDRRKDRFTPESVALWEMLGDYLAIALAKFRSDEQLQKSEEQFRTLADSISNLAWWANGDGYITWYNQRWYEYTGTTPEQMEGWGWQRVHDPKVLPMVLERWQTSIATGEPFDMEFPLRGADGVFRPFLTRVMPVKDSAGLVLRWFGTNTDISAQKQVEESLLQRTSELEIVNKELESFIYSVSHDLRAPLRHISGFADLLMKGIGEKTDDKDRRYLSIIHSGTEKMSRLIDDLLNLSRISKQEIRRTQVDVSKMTRSKVDELQDTYSGRSVEVDIKEGMTAVADKGLLELVLSNLLENAWKFTSKTEHARIEVSTTQKDGKLIYYVRDNGAGFDQKYAGRMFWPFHRLHAAGAFEGTGIGLAIVDRIIRSHGGKVWAEGAEGKEQRSISV